MRNSARDAAGREGVSPAAKIDEQLARGGLLSVPHELATLEDMVLSPSTRKQLSRVVLEHTRRAALLARGLRPSRKLLFVGLPGTGKTMAAGALARAVKLPMFRVELHGVFSSMFAQSARRLAKVFDYVRSMSAVYLFDEFDSIAADRASVGSESDGGESRRVVNALLQFIEGDQSDSLIVAATNHAQLLDAAIFRRFDEMVRFDPLTKDEFVELIRRRLVGFEVAPLDYNVIYAEVNQELGHADLCVALSRVCKDHVLEGGIITTKEIVEGIVERMHLRAAVAGRGWR